MPIALLGNQVVANDNCVGILSVSTDMLASIFVNNVDKPVTVSQKILSLFVIISCHNDKPLKSLSDMKVLPNFH
jgi:predicted amino acid-binding ACT domain protein